MGDIVERAVKEVLSRDNINPVDYDINSDGYLDGIEIIYKTTQSMTEETTSFGGASLRAFIPSRIKIRLLLTAISGPYIPKLRPLLP